MCVNILIYTGRQGLFQVGLPKHCRGVEGVMGDGEYTMDPGCGPNFVLPQGQKDGEKLRNKGQKFWCTPAWGRGSLRLGWGTYVNFHVCC